VSLRVPGSKELATFLRRQPASEARGSLACKESNAAVRVVLCPKSRINNGKIQFCGNVRDLEAREVAVHAREDHVRQRNVMESHVSDFPRDGDDLRCREECPPDLGQCFSFIATQQILTAKKDRASQVSWVNDVGVHDRDSSGTKEPESLEDLVTQRPSTHQDSVEVVHSLLMENRFRKPGIVWHGTWGGRERPTIPVSICLPQPLDKP